MSPSRQVPVAAPGADAGASGLAARWIARLFFRNAQVSDKQLLAPAMYLITLTGLELRGFHWSPGDKLQIRTGDSLLTRTYTPLFWDGVAGQTQILAHSLAAGPGSEWVRRVAIGQPISLLGPRRSLDLERFDPQASVVVGDETAIGLVAAWRPAHAVIETRQQASIQSLLDNMGLTRTAVASQTDGNDLGALISSSLGAAAHDQRYVLVGRARSVQTLLMALRRQGVNANRILTKAYWADGKPGLD